MKIFSVVSQQHALQQWGELEYFGVRRPIVIELADGHHIVPVAAQNVELRARLRIHIHQDSQAGALAATSTFARFKRCRSSFASASISALFASQYAKISSDRKSVV